MAGNILAEFFSQDLSFSQSSDSLEAASGNIIQALSLHCMVGDQVTGKEEGHGQDLKLRHEEAVVALSESPVKIVQSNGFPFAHLAEKLLYKFVSPGVYLKQILVCLLLDQPHWFEEPLQHVADGKL